MKTHTELGYNTWLRDRAGKIRYKVVNNFSVGEVLEIGCGDCEYINYPKDKYIGIDINKKYLKKAREKGFNVLYMNAEKIKFNKKFDTIVCIELIEHLESYKRLIKGISKHLKDNGLLILSTPNKITHLTNHNPFHKKLYSYNDLKLIFNDYKVLVKYGIFCTRKDFLFCNQISYIWEKLLPFKIQCSMVLVMKKIEGKK